MPDRINPGIGPLERRLAAIERLLTRVGKVRVKVAKQIGTGMQNLEVLAITEGSAANSSQPVNPEAFCGIYQRGGKWYMRGGPVSCADKNFDVNDLELTNPKSQSLLYLEVKCVVNRDDDNQAFLPGINKATDTNIAIQRTTSDNYPDSHNPSLKTGAGKLVVPLGKLATVTTGDPVFTSAWCGKVTVSHCNGTLTYS